MRYEIPDVTDFGSIADHTFTRCNPGGALPGGPPGGKDPNPIYGYDKFQECSSGHTGLTP